MVFNKLREISGTFFQDGMNKEIFLELTPALFFLVNHVEREGDFEERVENLNMSWISNEKLFDLLEYLLISDKSPSIRRGAALCLLHLYPKKCSKPIIWAIQHERSIIILKTLHDFIFSHDTSEMKVLRFFLNKRLEHLYKIVPEEAGVLLELGAIKVRKNIVHDYKIIIEKKHVITLELPGWHLKKLPRCIGNLKRLKLLNLWDNNLTHLPSTFRKLTALQSLYLDWNHFSKLPYVLSHMKSLKKISLTNNNRLKKLPDSMLKLSRKVTAPHYEFENVHSEDATILGLLEIIIGQKLKQLQENGPLSKTCACHYKINQDGRVIGIYIYGYYFFQISFFPEQISKLKYLEELSIRDQNINSIPNSIEQLLHLKKLDLMNNQFNEIPDVLLRLKSLKLVDLSYNQINQIPPRFLRKKMEIWV
ncbi:MAG: leucine-rich repeat domain-containing protein [Promethearchaeota archaeon]